MSSQHNTKQMYIAAKVPLHKVIVFPQVRKTFHKAELQILADDIALHGVLQPSIVGKLSPEMFTKYKDTFQLISGVTLDPIESFHSIDESGKKWYYPLIAGERRYRAHKLLWDEGCTTCKERAQNQQRQLNPGECYKKHFHSSFIEVRACVNIDPITAKSAQFRENNYVKPPIYEEAYAYKEFYLYLKSADEKMNITKFSRIVGVSQDKIRKALWFCDLPKHLRDSVEKKYVSYSNALEIKRLIEVFGGKKKSLIEQEIDFLLLYPRIKHEDYKARVDMLIMDASQATLFDITPFQMTKKLKRRVVEKHYVYYLSMMARYTNKIQELKNMGVLGRGKLYSEISPKKQLAQIVHSLELIFPNFSFPPDFIEYIKTNITKPVS